MNYCPGCQEPLKNDTDQCPYCGYELIGTEKVEAGLKPASTTNISSKKPFYKRAVFLVPFITIIVLGILAGTGFATYRFYQNKKKADFEKELKSIWTEITNRSEYLATNISLLKKSSDLANLEEDLTSFNDFLSSKQSQASNLEAPPGYENNQSGLVDAIEKYGSYIYLLKLVLQKESSAVESSDYAKIKIFSEDAEAAAEKFVAEAVFIDNNLQASIFSALEKIEPIISKIKSQELAEKKQTLKARQSAAKKAAQRTVSSFMQARIDQNATEMRRYITPGYDKVFDAEQEFAVTDTYSIDFRITSTKDISAKEFQIEGVETGKDITGAKFENKWWFRVIKYEGDWLIDNRRLLNE